MELLSAAVAAKDLGTRKSTTVLSTSFASVVTFQCWALTTPYLTG